MIVEAISSSGIRKPRKPLRTSWLCSICVVACLALASCTGNERVECVELSHEFVVVLDSIRDANGYGADWTVLWLGDRGELNDSQRKLMDVLIERDERLSEYDSIQDVVRHQVAGRMDSLSMINPVRELITFNGHDSVLWILTRHLKSDAVSIDRMGAVGSLRDSALSILDQPWRKMCR